MRGGSIDDLSVIRITNLFYLPLRSYHRMSSFASHFCSTSTSRELSILTKFTLLRLSGCNINAISYHYLQIISISVNSSTLPCAITITFFLVPSEVFIFSWFH